MKDRYYNITMIPADAPAMDVEQKLGDSTLIKAFDDGRILVGTPWPEHITIEGLAIAVMDAAMNGHPDSELNAQYGGDWRSISAMNSALLEYVGNRIAAGDIPMALMPLDFTRFGPVSGTYCANLAKDPRWI